MRLRMKQAWPGASESAEGLQTKYPGPGGLWGTQDLHNKHVTFTDEQTKHGVQGGIDQRGDLGEMRCKICLCDKNFGCFRRGPATPCATECVDGDD